MKHTRMDCVARMLTVACLALIGTMAALMPTHTAGAVGLGYVKADGRYAKVEPITLSASGTQTVTGNGSSIELGDCAVARLKLNVTAASGTTPNLTVTVQTSSDGVTWYTAGTFTAATGVTSEQKIFPIDRFIRASWAITGTTPSFTFSVLGEGT